MFSRAPRMLLVLLAVSLGWAQAIPDTFAGVERVVAVGDLHGDLDRFVTVLRQAQLIDESSHWTGGRSHLVLCGDMIDRGSRSAQVLDLVMALEEQAIQAGGRVHALIGNHEAMNVESDFRYVSAEDYESFRTPDSERLRRNQMETALSNLRLNGQEPSDVEAWIRQYLAAHPLGWVERSLAFGPQGKYGKWLGQHNAIVKINDALFMHGGLSEKYVKRHVNDINERVRSELSNPNRMRGGISHDEEGPLWYRGLIQAPEDDPAELRLVSRILEFQGVRHIVVGHTPNPAVMPRFDGRVIGVDVGLARVMSGQPAFLLVENGVYYAVHQGRQLRLPVSGESVLEYLGAAAALDPPNSRLRILLENRRR